MIVQNEPGSGDGRADMSVTILRTGPNAACFFFQAEDGIRDKLVTGVQTCALPISGAPVVVVSHALWTSRFASDPAIVGRTITIDGKPHTVIGVMPTGRGYPRDADLWRPLTASEREDHDRELVMIGRLTSGTSVEQASVPLATVATSASAGTRRAWVEDVQRTEVREVRAALTALLVSSALILLMACANVAALVGARGADRAGEMAVRGA